MSPSVNSYGARSTLTVDGRSYVYYRLDALGVGHADKLPFSLKVLLENLIRSEDNVTVSREDIAALASWNPTNVE